MTTVRRALWASTSPATRGGVATYVRTMQDTPLWHTWHIHHVTTHRDGSAVAKVETFAVGAIRFVVELIRHRPDVVHLHSSAGASFVRKAILLWTSWLARVPVVMHMHGSDFVAFHDGSPRPVRWVIRGTLRRARAVVALGDGWSLQLRRIAPGARIVVVPNALRSADRVRQPGPGEPVRVVFLGRMGERKGTFRLLAAWERMRADAAPARAAVLTVAGDGEVDRARRWVDDHGLGASVDVRPWLSAREVAALLDDAQVLVLPSRTEGQPMAILEAMARGMCVVAAPVGGIPDMIGDGCGVLVPADDVDALSTALRKVVEDERTRAGLGDAARERFARTFDVDVVWRSIDSLYREVQR
ncbi:putative glycosyltransferase [Rhodococcus sp. RD6.2]|uniref:glycosyltransferase family 4 protein n=1 Tax=Rhodococcus sp. RD6.2 TaxID=260936 RepID=UPI00063BCD10|nr:glycosyltransferase family 4 protein [Rhodococcus sp. RD6.2]CRK49505.1 putative glycosyltransferase [Rhodococcus sp. RD6.2]